MRRANAGHSANKKQISNHRKEKVLVQKTTPHDDWVKIHLDGSVSGSSWSRFFLIELRDGNPISIIDSAEPCIVKLYPSDGNGPLLLTFFL